MNSSKNKLNDKISWQFLSMSNAYLGSVWIPLITENWKYCSKIIFKYVNNIVRPNFKVDFIEFCTFEDPAKKNTDARSAAIQT